MNSDQRGSTDHEGADPGRPHDGLGFWRDLRRWFWSVACLGTLAAIWMVLYLRSGELGHPLVIAVVGLTSFLVLPLLVAVMAAWLSGSRPLRLATALTTGLFLVVIDPVAAVVGCGGHEPLADEITVYTANVLYFEGRPLEIAASIDAADPDVVVLQEIRWQFARDLSADPRMADYRFRSTDTEAAPTSTAVWSRWPISSTEVERLDRVPIAHNLIEGPNGAFTVTGIHLSAPARRGSVAPWNSELSELAAYPTDRPRILAGDFNATEDHLPFRRLLEGAWTDAHQPKGCGPDATWPVDHGLPFPVFRLDHVLVTNHFEVLGLEFGDPGGSDHKPVIARLRLAGAEKNGRP